MKMLSLCCCVLIIFIAAGAQHSAWAVLKAKPDKIWVKRNFTGGIQCSSVYRKTAIVTPSGKTEPAVRALPAVPEDAERYFKDAGITVFNKKDHHLPVCAACGYPAYSVDKFFLINSADLCKAEQIGFTAEDIEVTLVYEKRQCYRDNGFSPARVQESLAKNGIRCSTGDEEKPDIPICKACWPACSYSIRYTVYIPYEQYEKALEIINRLEQGPSS